MAVIVEVSGAGTEKAVILYEAALGISVGPLLGGLLGGIGWRGPFLGVAVLMSIGFVAILVLLPPIPLAEHKSSILEPILALGHRGLLTLGLTALCYNFGFFTLLAYTPFPLRLDAHGLGLVFFGWGVMLALTSVFLAPRADLVNIITAYRRNNDGRKIRCSVRTQHKDRAKDARLSRSLCQSYSVPMPGYL